MKILVKQSRNFIQLLRLVVGLAGTVQGFLVKEFALSLAGFLLVYMAVTDIGYFRANNCEVELKKG
jgi:CheY-specific phosphatase CheX